MIMKEVNIGLGRCDSCQGVGQSSGRCEIIRNVLRGVIVM